jgi:perosamine synthetase
MTWKIPLFKIYWEEDDLVGINEAIKKGMFWAIGPNIEKFEEMMAGYIGTKYAVTFNSGTSALHAVLLAKKIKEGDEVIVPSFTFIATANSPLFVNAKPVFADIEEDTLGLDPEDVKEKITDKTKAIIPIHYGGTPCKIKELKEIAEDHDLCLIEDAAESLGAKIRDKKVGTFGELNVFSFCANKVISTGEGGCVVTDSNDIYERLKLIRSHGRLETQNYFSSADRMDYIDLGYNFRMSNITAALGISQLSKVDKIIELRRSKAGYMTNKLSGQNDIILPKSSDEIYNVYQLFTIRIRSGEKNRTNLMNHLVKNGIMTKVYFDPVHLTYFYRKKLGEVSSLPITEKVSQQVLSLPMYPTLTDDDMNSITDEIHKFLRSDEYEK